MVESTYKQDSKAKNSQQTILENEFYRQSLQSNLGLTSEREQETLREARVAIAGLGEVGAVHLTMLAQLGIGKFTLANLETFEQGNSKTNAQLESMIDQLRAINPFSEYRSYPEGLNYHNLDEFLEGVDVVVDGLDYFCIDYRRALYKRAREKGIYVVTALPIGFGCTKLTFSPNSGLGFDEYFNINDEMSRQDKLYAFSLGLCPDFSTFKYLVAARLSGKPEYGPSLGPATYLCAGMAATDVSKILLGLAEPKTAPWTERFDPYLHHYSSKYVWGGNKNPFQRLKLLTLKYFLPPTEESAYSKREEPRDTIALTRKQIVTKLIDAAVQAPSAENSQPWHFISDGTNIRVLAKDMNTHFQDINNESTLISIGAAVENIRIAASKFGLSVIAKYNSGLIHAEEVVCLELVETPQTQEDPLLSSLSQRQTNRLPYLSQQIPPHMLQELNEEHEANHSDVLLRWTTEAEERKCVEDMSHKSCEILFGEEKLHHEVFKWCHAEKNSKAKRGMDLSVIGLNLSQRAGFPLIKNWSSLKQLNRFGFNKLLARDNTNIVKKSPAFAFIIFDNSSTKGIIEGGKAFERFWIHANSLGLSMQPLAGFGFLLNHYREDKAAKFSAEHQELIASIASSASKLFGEHAANKSIMAFRIGFAKSQTKKSPRVPAADVLDFVAPEQHQVQAQCNDRHRSGLKC